MKNNKKNIIIIGHGRAGSSILAGLISRNGYYINKEAIKARKNYPHGDFENPDLIPLNEAIFQSAGYKYTMKALYKKVNTECIEAVAKQCDIKKYQNFINTCNSNAPWLWKDPRLIFTIFFWKHLLDLKNIHFILINRDPYQIFKSYAKGSIIFTKKEIFKWYQYRLELIEKFLAENNLKAFQIDYAQLWQRDTINTALSGLTGTDISEVDYNYIVKKNIKKKESGISFLLRYYFGIFLLPVRRTYHYVKAWHNKS